MERIKSKRSKGKNGSEMEAGNHRYYRAEKTTMLWPRLKGSRGENTKINYGQVARERRKRERPRKKWMEEVQATMTTKNLEPDKWRNREEWLSFPEDGDSC